MGSIKAKLRVKHSNICNAKVMIKHQMIGFSQANKQGVKANFITSLVAKIGNKTVYELKTNEYLSKNPLFKFKFYAVSGEIVEITWVDLLGNSDTKFIAIR